MEIHKKGQAQTYRLIFAVIVLLFGVFGAWKWFMTFQQDIYFGVRIDWIGAAVCILLGLGLGLYFAFTHKRTAQYIIETDEEMRKVTWPNKEELRANSIIVIVVMVVLGVVTSAFDFVFTYIFDLLKAV